MFTITVPAHSPYLRSQDVRPRFIESAARPDVGHFADTVTTGDLVHVGPDRDVAIFVGLSPAGVVWVTDNATKVEPQREVLARLWARTMRTIPCVEVAL